MYKVENVSRINVIRVLINRSHVTVDSAKVPNTASITAGEASHDTNCTSFCTGASATDSSTLKALCKDVLQILARVASYLSNGFRHILLSSPTIQKSVAVLCVFLGWMILYRLSATQTTVDARDHLGFGRREGIVNAKYVTAYQES